ncbi:hypothetical protein K7432_004321 [Basidiobolus ranarum]|uniref:C2H2-type domain-containing protein n=1 Tax=Basidiobolus ranarum TaxID=34480 RepID=A0ABR2WYJ9_9FUNG
MTYSSIYPFYYCPSSKHSGGDGNNGCFDQVTALASTQFNSNLWRVKNCHGNAGLGISHTTDAHAPKQPLATLLPFSPTYGPTIGLNSACMNTQVKVEEPELLHFDGHHSQDTLLYGANTQNIDLSAQNLHNFTHRKYSIESVPGLYRDTCSPFGNHLGDNSSLENSPQPFFGEDFISSPIIQSPKSPSSYLCLEDTVFQAAATKNSSSISSANVVQQPSPIYPPSSANQQAFHVVNIPQRHHPYCQADLESRCQGESTSYAESPHTLGYNFTIGLGAHHTNESKNIEVKTEEVPSRMGHIDSPRPSLSKPMTAGQRNKSLNRPPTSMMTTFSSRITSPSAKRYHCTVCQKGFSRPSSLNTHMYSHTGEKPFQCPYEGCGRHFSVVSNLRRHTKIHSVKTN